MRFSSFSGTSGGVKRYGRWFVLAFICVALVLVLVPAVSLGSTTNVTLKAAPASVIAGGAVKLTATACSCPSGATFTLLSKGSSGSWTAVATSPASKCGTAVFNVRVLRNTSFEVTLKSSHTTVTSKAVCVKVCAKLTLCVTPPTYGGVGISGTLVPGWNGGKVTITIAKVVHCWRTVKVATLSVPLTQGVGDSSVFATSWTGAQGNTTYVFTVKVATTADFNGACVSKCRKL